MKRNVGLGAFEQLVLLAALRLGDQAYAPSMARELDARAGRDVSRGTLYAALDRLETKGYVEWSIEASTETSPPSFTRRWLKSLLPARSPRGLLG